MNNVVTEGNYPEGIEFLALSTALDYTVTCFEGYC